MKKKKKQLQRIPDIVFFYRSAYANEPVVRARNQTYPQTASIKTTNTQTNSTKKNTRKNTMNMRIFRVMLAHCDSGLGFLLASQIIDVFVIYIHFPSPARNILFFDLCVDKDRLLSICRSSRYAFGWMRSPPGHLDHIENGKNCQLDECNLEPHTAH